MSGEREAAWREKYGPSYSEGGDVGETARARIAAQIKSGVRERPLMVRSDGSFRDVHGNWHATAEHLGGTYTPNEDGDGGTLFVPDFLDGYAPTGGA